MKSVYYFLAVCAVALCLLSCDDDDNHTSLKVESPVEFSMGDYVSLIGDSEAGFLATYPKASKAGVNDKNGDNLSMMCKVDISDKCSCFGTMFEFINSELACIEFQKEYEPSEISFCSYTCEKICKLSEGDISISVEFGELKDAEVFTSVDELKACIAEENNKFLNYEDYYFEYSLTGKCENSAGEIVPVCINYRFISTVKEDGERETKARRLYRIGSLQ